MRSMIIAGTVLALLATALPGMAQHKKIAMASQPAASAITADPGDLLSTIEFQVQAEGEDAKVYSKGIIPWVNLAKTDDLKKLLNANEIVLPYMKVTVVATAPRAASFVLKGGDRGFSRVELVKAISDKITKLPSQRPDAPVNLSTADVYENEAGIITIKLQVEP